MIVEDERIVAADLQHTLAELGYDPYAVAATGEKALSLAADSPPDIVLADIRISGPMDGVDTAICLRRSYGAGVIFLTAHTDEATLVRAKSADPFGYLVKPISAPGVRAAIEMALDRWTREAQRRARELAGTHTGARLWNALDQMPLAVQLEDEQQRIVHVNEAFRAMFGVQDSLPKLTGSDSAVLMHRIAGLCEAPGQFTSDVDALRRSTLTITGELIRLLDGRILERDYVPIREGLFRTGQLWTYREVSERERERIAVEEAAVRHRQAMLVDELTGLNGRRGFYHLAGTYLAMPRRRDESKILFFIDLNDLKGINDRLGHATGDEAIFEFARALRGTFRDSDLIARLGGDEFVVLAMLPPQEVGHVRRRLLERLEQFNTSAGRPYRLAASIGAVEYRPNESLDKLVARADEAMYEDKRAGKQLLSD